MLGIENPNVLCNQSAKWVQGQAAHRSFHASFMQFLDDTRTPLLSESFLPQIPNAADQSSEDSNDEQQESPPRQTLQERPWRRTLSERRRNFRSLEESGHGK